MKNRISLLTLVVLLAVLTLPSYAQSTRGAGSVVVFERYAASAVPSASHDTPMRLTNTHRRVAVWVRLLFLQADTLEERSEVIRLAAGQSVVLRASAFDPGVKGHLLAIACDERGLPHQFNWLTGKLARQGGWEPVTALAKLTPGSLVAVNETAALKFGEAEEPMYEPLAARVLPSGRWLLSLKDKLDSFGLAAQARVSVSRRDKKS